MVPPGLVADGVDADGRRLPSVSRHHASPSPERRPGQPARPGWNGFRFLNSGDRENDSEMEDSKLEPMKSPTPIYLCKFYIEYKRVKGVQDFLPEHHVSSFESSTSNYKILK